MKQQNIDHVNSCAVYVGSWAHNRTRVGHGVVDPTTHTRVPTRPRPHIYDARVDMIYILLFHQNYDLAYQDFLVSDCLTPCLDGL